MRGRADLLLGQRGASREALGGRKGLRHVRADFARGADADQERAAEADRQGAGAKPEEHRPRLSRYAVRSRQQVLGPLRVWNDEHRLQRREGEGAGASHRHVGVDLRAQAPDEDQGPHHRARQRGRALRCRPHLPRLFGERRRSQALGRSRRRDQEGEALLGRVQLVVVHQGAHGRQYLGRAGILGRHLPGQ